jgi:HicB-like protein involved in pilus formation
MPPDLHGELAQAAEREGISLNKLIVNRLSGEAASPVPAGDAPKPRSRFLNYALVVNFAVLLVTGTAAVVLLVSALH